MLAPARLIDVSSSVDRALAVDPAVGGRRLDHRVLPRHVVRRNRDIDRVGDRSDDIEIADRRLHHHHVGALGDVELRLAHRLRRRPGRVLLVRRAIAELRRALGRVAERAVERRGVLRGVGEDRDVGEAVAVQGRSGSRRPGRPSSRSARPHGRRPRPGRPRSRRTARAWRRCRPRRPTVSRPQWPWSVYSSRHRSAHHDRRRRRPRRRGRAAPAGRCRPDRPRRLPRASFDRRDPEQHHATDAGLRGLDRRLADRVAGVLDDAGHRRDRHRVRRSPSLTNSGSTRSDGVRPTTCDDQPSQRRRPAQPARPRRRGTPPAGCVTSPSWPARTALARLALPGGSSLAGLAAGPTELRQPLGQRRRPTASAAMHVDPQAELLGRLRRLRPDHRDDARGVRLAGDADEVAHRRGRREQHRVEPAGLDRLARLGAAAARRAPCGRRSRRRPASRARAARPTASRSRCRRAAAAPGRARRSPARTSGQSASRPSLDCSPLGTRSGRIAPGDHRRRGLLADAGDLHAGQGTRVEPELLDLLADRLGRVDRRQRQPGVAAADQAADRAVDRLRGARRLDRDRRDLDRDRAVATSAARTARRPAPWSAGPAPSSRTTACSPTTTASRAA